MGTSILPGDSEFYARFSEHIGGRFSAAGLGIQFHFNQPPGIHFKAAVSEDYRPAIVQGLQEGMALRFPDFPSSRAIWVTEVSEHPVDSSANAFYLAARLVVEQAYSLPNVQNKLPSSSTSRQPEASEAGAVPGRSGGSPPIWGAVAEAI